MGSSAVVVGQGGAQCLTLVLIVPVHLPSLPSRLPASHVLPRPPAESLSTLKFANRAKCMRNLPKVGRLPLDRLLLLDGWWHKTGGRLRWPDCLPWLLPQFPVR